ncbi:aminoglycoside phosphotransferase [Microbacterium sp. 179-B 1A2 NHS]|uniref:maltokinase N-terminal cap-like domain-containing protein n=1 Tax=Microbacterium sp. 179-B 1A2 NHS TaxID=3142383 RepID=UPI0039A2E869
MERVLESLTTWMPRQRWYANKAHTPQLALDARWELPSADPDATIAVLLVRDVAGGETVRYQVPVVERPTALTPATVIARTDAGVLVDGPHDPAYARALLAAIAGDAGDGIRGTAVAPIDPDAYRAKVLSGEQSNTSIVYRSDSGALPLICKVFRQVSAGIHPDVELQVALAQHGCRHVAAAAGWIDGEWAAPGEAAQTAALAFAQEFLTGVEDAWRVALRAARSGEPFADEAASMGRAVADVHAHLADAFPGATASEAARDGILAVWERRLAMAVAEVPQLAAHADGIRAVYRRAADTDWPPLQRVHGDLHLGQVIHTPDRGWLLLDFEGEPLRPMPERREVDLSLRDVAGILRSFDYAAGTVQLEDPGLADRAAEWSRTARDAFLAGYAEAVPGPLDEPLLAALVLDKAVYETVYEARNRPTWIEIPLRAVADLSA